MKQKGIIYRIFVLILAISISTPYFPVQAEGRSSSENEALTLTEPAAKESVSLSANPNTKDNELPPVISSVVQDAYGAESPTITRLKELTLEKQVQENSFGAQGKVSSFATAQNANTSRDLSQSEVEELVRAGATIEDIYWLNYLHQGHEEIPAIDLYNLKKDGQSWEGIERELTAGLQDFNSVQESVYEESAMGMDVLKSKRSTVSEDVYDKPASKALDGQQMTLATTSFDTMLRNVMGGLVMQDFINQSGKEQYSDHSGNSEVVDPASGALNWQTQLLNLPGRDGLDLNIGLTHQSTQAFAYMRKYSTSINGQNNIVEKYNYAAYRYDLGIGWSFQFPSVQYLDGYSYYHDGHGATYQIGGAPNDAMSAYTQLMGFSDKSARYLTNRFNQSPATFNNGEETSVSYLLYSDNKKEFFGADGRLLGIVDRFGNTLTFRYINRTTYDGVTHNVLSSITDTLGRVVTFNYETNLNTAGAFYGENIEIVAKSGATEIKRITLTKNRLSLTKNGVADGYAPVLWKIKNNAEPQNITSFDYGNTQANFDYYYKSTSYGTGWTSYHPVTAINYPSSKTSYEYDTIARNLGSSGFADDMRVKFRKDTAGAQTFNKTAYSYNGDYTGVSQYTNPYDIPYTYFYGSTRTVNSDTKTNALATTFTFNYEGKLIETATQAANGERTVTKNTTFDMVFRSFPTLTETFEYAVGDTDATANHLYAETSYTELGQLKSQTLPMTYDQWRDESINAHLTISYTYHPVSQQITSKKWYQRLVDTEILGEYYVTPYDGNSRLASFTNAKGDKTSYTYVLNNLGQVTQVTAETVSDNKLTAKSVVKYGSEYSYAYPTEQQSWMNIGQTNQQIVTTTMSYTPDGQLKNQIDGKQKITAYEYDPVGRPQKVTYPTTTDSNGYQYSESDNFSYIYLSPSDLDAVNSGMPTLEVSSTKTVNQLTSAGALVRSVDTKVKSYYNGLGLLLLEKKFDETLNAWVSTQYHYDDQ